MTLWVAELLLFFQLKTSQKYHFGKRDSTEAGDPLSRVIDLVKNRYLLSPLPLNYDSAGSVARKTTLLLIWRHKVTLGWALYCSSTAWFPCHDCYSRCNHSRISAIKLETAPFSNRCENKLLLIVDLGPFTVFDRIINPRTWIFKIGHSYRVVAFGFNYCWTRQVSLAGFFSGIVTPPPLIFNGPPLRTQHNDPAWPELWLLDAESKALNLGYRSFSQTSLKRCPNLNRLLTSIPCRVFREVITRQMLLESYSRK